MSQFFFQDSLRYANKNHRGHNSTGASIFCMDKGTN